jgi:hypothetical protein
LAWDLEQWKLKQGQDEGGQEITEEPPKPEQDENKEETKGILKIKKWLSFDKNLNIFFFLSKNLEEIL